jgi:hypothetical protein
VVEDGDRGKKREKDREKKVPDMLGKRALYWVPGGDGAGSGVGAGGEAAGKSGGKGGGKGAKSGKASHPAGGGTSTITLPMGKRALYSGARPESHSARFTSENPLVERGMFVVQCERCHQTSHVGLLDLLIYQFPIGGWLPRGQYDRRMTCPSCRHRTWCSVSLRRGAP